jgi:3-oxoacyl-[acyl-carrier-protein] synthase-3
MKKDLNNSIYLLGLGHYVPEEVLTNAQLEQLVDTSDEWIVTRTGIKKRRIAKKGQACSDLAYFASKKALENAGISPLEITHIILGTFTPDFCVPASACLLQAKLGAKHCEMAIDIAAGCSGFTYGLELARGLTRINPEAKILLVGSEVCSSRVNFKDRNTCVLFGDGAGAAIFTGNSKYNPKVVDILLKTNGDFGYLLQVGLEGGSALPFKVGQQVTEKYFIHMKGRELFKHAVRGMTEMNETILKKNGLDVSDVDLFIPHQANYRIIKALAKKLNLPLEKVYINIHNYGNTSAASVIIALSEAYYKGIIKKDYTVLMSTFGAGLTWASVILQF